MHRVFVYRASARCNAAAVELKSTAVLIRAGHSSKLRLLGISTVAGNQTVEKVTVNALGVVDAAGLQSISKFAATQTGQIRQLRRLTSRVHRADVYKGQPKPLMRPLVRKLSFTHCSASTADVVSACTLQSL